MGTLQVGGTTLGVKNTSTNKIDLSNAGDVNISGDITKDSLPMYACRAWVNFDGTKDTSGASSTGTTNRLIRASGNVASVLRNGTGDYTITFTTPMPDANYSTNVSAKQDEVGGGTYVFGSFYAGSGATVANVFQTNSVRVTCNIGNGTSLYDAVVMCVSIFR